MNKRVLAAVLLAVGGLGFVLGQAVDSTLPQIISAKPGEMYPVAQKLYINYVGAQARATSAPQATQVATEANVEYQLMIVKQNDEIIRLLKKLAGEK